MSGSGIIGLVPSMCMATRPIKSLENIRKSFVTCQPDYFFSWMCILTAYAGRTLAFIWLTTIFSIGQIARITRARWFLSLTAMRSIIGGAIRAQSRLILRIITITVILHPETRICTGFGSGRPSEIEELVDRGVGIRV